MATRSFRAKSQKWIVGLQRSHDVHVGTVSFCNRPSAMPHFPHEMWCGARSELHCVCAGTGTGGDPRPQNWPRW